MPKHDNSEPSDPVPSTDDSQHADHIAGKHYHKYDPDCADCRLAAEQEYKKKLASGELNKIEFVD